MKCKLCKTNDAGKQESHIVPKFLGKSLKNDKGQINSVEITPRNIKGC